MLAGDEAAAAGCSFVRARVFCASAGVHTGGRETVRNGNCRAGMGAGRLVVEAGGGGVGGGAGGDGGEPCLADRDRRTHIASRSGHFVAFKAPFLALRRVGQFGYEQG